MMGSIRVAEAAGPVVRDGSSPQNALQDTWYGEFEDLDAVLAAGETFLEDAVAAKPP
ncbi:hypothetical protein [Curtobacterium sp. SGAir0471]|uniref:hypothetical protein n=1 Tax=Curtobacterium sp. SGAir0471 TaxID=2070337 RepID=UPI001586537D|nr:hypothetical protein [Curtobacterium sp. SGAir0471]